MPKSGVQQPLQQAVAFHQQGRLDDAEWLYRGILAGAPNSFDALHLLGVLMKQRGRSADALRLIDKALAANARSADALQNRANVLFEKSASPMRWPATTRRWRCGPTIPG
ncbi:MAG: tetratricopeptide repeat protein [Xanthobacteraceae bacterium]